MANNIGWQLTFFLCRLAALREKKLSRKAAKPQKNLLKIVLLT
jgi:hypothetical protein